jgi:chromosome segregation and condensation protein ScpB
VCREGCEGVDSASLDYSLFLATFQTLSIISINTPVLSAKVWLTPDVRVQRVDSVSLDYSLFLATFQTLSFIAVNTPVLSAEVWLTPDVRVQRGLWEGVCR